MEVPKFGTIMPNKVISGGHISGGHFSGGHISGGDFSIGNVSGGYFSGGYFSSRCFSVYCLLKCWPLKYSPMKWNPFELQEIDLLNSLRALIVLWYTWNIYFDINSTKVQLSLRDSNRLDEVRCSLTFDRSRFLNSPGLFTQMHIILHESVLSGHILLNKIFRFSLIFQTRLQKVDKIFRVL